MGRGFLAPDGVRGLVAERFGTNRRVTRLDRLTGGSKKGVYRLALDDGTTAVLYRWSPAENFWPASPPTVPDDPFTDASGADLFAASHAALTAAGVRVPRLLLLDRSRRHLDADLALVEDAGGRTLEAVLADEPDAVALARFRDELRRMRCATSDSWGRVADLAAGTAPQARRTEDVVADRASVHLAAAAERDGRIAAAADRIAAHLRGLRAAVRPRRRFSLVHGELGPDHVLVTAAGEPVLIDIEGLAYFDAEWEHAWLAMRFGDAYRVLRPDGLDPARLALFEYAQALSLVEGPLRIADTDFPDRQWMLDLAEHHIGRALAAL